MTTKTKSPPRSADETAPGARVWSEALRNPALHDLPFKIETNAQGQLVLTAKKFYHSDLQGDVMPLLASEHGPTEKGKPLPECAVYTTEGVRVPDVVWISDERVAQIPEDAEASPVMPEICVEVLSASNTEAEMDEKRHLFFEGGAEEVWMVDADGHVTFYGAGGARETSTLAPGFPSNVGR